jgi:hypothetical protein
MVDRNPRNDARLMWKNRDVSYRPVVMLAAVLLVVGLLTTFPPFFDLFAGD